MKKGHILSLIAFIYATSAYAQQNSIYVDQVGSGSTISLTQTGVGNIIGNSTTKAVFNGNNNSVTVDQIGNSNILAINVQGAGTTITSSTTGDGNDVSISCGVGGDCTTSLITNTIVGDGNTVVQNTEGLTISTVSINSDNNTVTINNTSTAVSGTKSNVDISGGGGNQVAITQAGAAGINGHDASIIIIGATNDVDIRQGGNNDSKVISTITGSGNTLTVKSNHQ
jgi:hypothetical protein